MAQAPAPVADRRAAILAATERALEHADPDANDPEAAALWEALTLAFDELGLTMPTINLDNIICGHCGSPASAPDPTCSECPETDRVPCQIDNSCTYIAEDEDDLESHHRAAHPDQICDECPATEDVSKIWGARLCPSCYHNAMRSGWTGNN